MAVPFSQEEDKTEQMEIQNSYIFIYATQPRPNPAVTLAFLEKICKKAVAIKTTETGPPLQPVLESFGHPFHDSKPMQILWSNY